MRIICLRLRPGESNFAIGRSALGGEIETLATCDRLKQERLVRLSKVMRSHLHIDCQSPEKRSACRRFRQLLAMLAAIAIALLSPANSQAGPRAVVREATVDFGAVAKGDVVEHVFEIENAGDAMLHFSDSRSTCGCSVLNYDEEIQPGATGQVRVQIDTRTVNGPAQTNVLIQTSDPERTELHLVLKIDVQTSIGVHPPRARWDTVETETGGTNGVTVFALDGKPFSITSVDVSNADIDATFRRANDTERIAQFPGDQWRMELTLSETSAIGAIEGYATVTIDHGKQKRTFVPVSGFVRPLIHVSPEVTDLGEIVLETTSRRAHYEVRNFGTAPMSIGQVEVQGVEGLTTSVVERVKGHTFDVFVHFDPAQVGRGAFAGRVLMHTDLVNRKTIAIDIEGVVVAASEE